MTTDEALKIARGHYCHGSGCDVFQTACVRCRKLQSLLLRADSDARAEEREACAAAVERAYLACTEPGVFNRHVWSEIVEQAATEIRARGEVKA